MPYDTKAAAVTPPVAGKNVWAVPADDFSTSSYIEVPDEWKNAIIRLEAQGDEDWYFLFADSTLATIAATTESTVVANAFTAVGNVPYHLESNTYVDVDLSLVDDALLDRIVLLAETGTATNLLRISRNSGYVRQG